MKRFIVIISAFFCLSMAQDIAGSWTLTAVDVWYYNFARPNPATADPAFGANQLATPLYVSDTYGLGASLPLAWLPAGAMFLGVPNGPYGEGGLAFNEVNLNVTLESDGTGSIPNGSTYPDIELDEELCVTFGQVLPVTDDIIYSATPDAGVTLQETDIVGMPSGNRYAGTPVGTMSLSQSVVFSFFPETAAHDSSPFPLYFGASEGDVGAINVDQTGANPTWIIPATSLAPNADGLYTSVGTTGGYIKTDGFDGSIGDDGPLSGGDNVDPELALYWHSMDGWSAETGLGDDMQVDEDGDGAVLGPVLGAYDRIFGLPAITSTNVDAAFAATLGFGDDFGYHVAGDIQAPLQDLLYGGCLEQVAGGVYGGCIGQVYDAVNAQCEGAGGPVNAVTGLCYEASQTDDFAGACNYYGAASALSLTCLQLGFSEEVCSEAGTQGMDAVNAYCMYLTNGQAADCATAGIDECSILTDPDFSLGLCGTLAGALTTSETCTEWVDSFYDYDEDPDSDTYGEIIGDSFFDANAASVLGMSCTDYSNALGAGLAAGDPTSIATLDEMAAGVLGMSCTNYSAYAVSTSTEVTTSDDYDDLDKANQFYVMNPDPNYATWSYFVTYNGFLYGTPTIGGQANPNYGNTALLVDDSDHDANIIYLDAITGTPCDPLNDGPTCAVPYAADGGRLVFEYSPTCVPVLEAMEVQTEFVGVAAGECNNDGDANGDGSVTVLDIVVIVQHVLQNMLLDDAAACNADINSDGGVTVLDIVVIVNQILNGRGEAATSAEFNRVGDALEMSANGIVDAVQITLSHGNDFSIELTDNALVADYSTKDNQTTLIIVSPEGNEIFTANGEYVIDEVVAANTNGYIETSMPVSFNLSEAYPNPFNPSTSLDITLSNEGSVSIMAYNVMGQMVGTLHEGNMNAGSHTITWDASSLASGMYIIKAEVAGNIVNKKVMLLK